MMPLEALCAPPLTSWEQSAESARMHAAAWTLHHAEAHKRDCSSLSYLLRDYFGWHR